MLQKQILVYIFLVARILLSAGIVSENTIKIEILEPEDAKSKQIIWTQIIWIPLGQKHRNNPIKMLITSTFGPLYCGH